MTRTCECGAPLGPRNTAGWCVKCKGGQNRIPIPADFSRRAPAMTNDEACAEWSVSRNTITAWRKVTGAKPTYRRAPPPNRYKTPADFAEIAPTKTLSALAAHYRFSEPTARRICRELGVDFFRPVSQPRKSKLIALANMGKCTIAAAMTAPQNRDMSLAGRAADFLQKRSAIWRCDETGRFQLGGTHWRWKGEARTAEYIIEEALQAGFNPDAWKDLAA
jgi:hypothetical protein